jgi:hypothetical protein
MRAARMAGQSLPPWKSVGEQAQEQGFATLDSLLKQQGQRLEILLAPPNKVVVTASGSI